MPAQQLEARGTAEFTLEMLRSPPAKRRRPAELVDGTLDLAELLELDVYDAADNVSILDALLTQSAASHVLVPASLVRDTVEASISGHTGVGSSAENRLIEEVTTLVYQLGMPIGDIELQLKKLQKTLVADVAALKCRLIKAGRCEVDLKAQVHQLTRELAEARANEQRAVARSLSAVNAANSKRAAAERELAELRAAVTARSPRCRTDRRTPKTVATGFECKRPGSAPLTTANAGLFKPIKQPEQAANATFSPPSKRQISADCQATPAKAGLEVGQWCKFGSS